MMKLSRKELKLQNQNFKSISFDLSLDINDITKDEIINDLSEFNRDDLTILLVRNKIDLKNQSDIKMESLLKSCKDFDINEFRNFSDSKRPFKTIKI